MSVEGGEGERYNQPKQIEAPKEEGLAPREQIDLDTARAILQAIVNTHENTITETTSLDQVQVAGEKYSIGRIQEAERMVAQSLMDERGVTEISKSGTKIDEQGRRTPYLVLGGGRHIYQLVKHTPQGNLVLRLDEKSVDMSLYGEDQARSVLRNVYPLEQPEQEKLAHFGYKDSRPRGEGASLASLNKGLSLGKIQVMWRGARWMNANMLNWDDPNTIMPEDLDTTSGSPSPDTP